MAEAGRARAITAGTNDGRHMISKELAKEQITRLAGLRKFPHGEPAAIRELLLALQTSATDEIARATVDNFVTYHTECPVPSLIRAEAWRRNQLLTPDPDPEQQWGPRPKLCRDCRGWGTKGEPPNAVFCSCPDGVAFRTVPKLGARWFALVNSPRTHRGKKPLQVHPGEVTQLLTEVK